MYAKAPRRAIFNYARSNTGFETQHRAVTFLRYLETKVAMDEKINLREFGIQCEDQEAFSAAVVALRAHLEGDPTDSFAWMILGDAYKVLSRFGDARSAMDQALIYASPNRRWMVMIRRARG
jgi:cytochrome c-type biogenesis protein CcmH/NrfG